MFTFYLGGMGSWDKTFPSGIPPKPRHRATATTVGTKIFVIGGSVDNEQVDDLALFNTGMYPFSHLLCTQSSHFFLHTPHHSLTLTITY